MRLKTLVNGKFWKLGLPIAIALGLFHLPGTGAPTQAGPLRIDAAAIPSFNNFTSTTEFGAFTWRGGLTLTSSSKDFGGLSGLVISNNCQDLLAISDRGNWLSAKLDYADGTLSGLTAPRLERMRDSKGNPLRTGKWSDAEAIAHLPSGKIAVAFERMVRVGTYDPASKGLTAPLKPLPYPQAIDDGPWNGEIESLGQLLSGGFIAIAERQRDANGNNLAWIWNGTSSITFAIERYGSYNVTDLAVLDDGSVLILERRITKTSLPGMLIRRFDPKSAKPGVLIKPELLLEAKLPLYAIDNMEGLALCKRNGETRVTLVSDNNFNTAIQSTVLLQFAYKPDGASP